MRDGVDEIDARKVVAVVKCISLNASIRRVRCRVISDPAGKRMIDRYIEARRVRVAHAASVKNPAQAMLYLFPAKMDLYESDAR